MGRTPVIERGTAIRAARDVFWRCGYDAAGIPELEVATGMGRSSLYHAFGSKRGLFDAAVQSYLDEVIRPRLRPLQDDPVSPSALLEYLEGLRGALAAEGSSPSRHGCLLVNAAASPLAEDPEVSRIITGYRSALHRAIGRGVLAHGASEGPAAGDECPGSRPGPEVLADAVTGLVISAFALTRIAPREAIASLDAAMGLLIDARRRGGSVPGADLHDDPSGTSALEEE